MLLMSSTALQRAADLPRRDIVNSLMTDIGEYGDDANSVLDAINNLSEEYKSAEGGSLLSEP